MPEPRRASRLGQSSLGDKEGRSADRTAAFFLFEARGDVGIRREANSPAFDVRHEAQRHEMMMTPMSALAAVCLRQLDAIALDAIDGSYVNTVCAYDFGMLMDSGSIKH
jgi:hypothetical protein